MPTCASCAADNLPEARFCGACGAALPLPPTDNPYQAPVGASPPATPPRGAAGAVTALVLGCIGLVVWLLPLLGLPCTIIGLVAGIRARGGARPAMAIIGVVLCGLGLLLSLINAAIGAYLGATGQLFPPAGADSAY